MLGFLSGIVFPSLVSEPSAVTNFIGGCIAAPPVREAHERAATKQHVGDKGEQECDDYGLEETARIEHDQLIDNVCTETNEADGSDGDEASVTARIPLRTRSSRQ